MGSVNNYPVEETKPGTNQKEEPIVYRLSNSVYYFIESVYIIVGKNNYRLVALKHSRVLYDQNYKTLRGCKIAFSKLFNHRTWKDNVKAFWTDAYQTEQGWHENINNTVESNG